MIEDTDEVITDILPKCIIGLLLSQNVNMSACSACSLMDNVMSCLSGKMGKKQKQNVNECNCRKLPDNVQKKEVDTK